LTDKSFVIFKSSTLNKLLEEKQTQGAFEYFGVKYILGYSDELSDQITTQTGVINIAPNSIEVDIGKVSGSKTFFMSLFR
jgi:hypothetical protein